ncbi:MAG: serine/threonine-protein kinase [Vicinamibacterales bacterium]
MSAVGGERPWDRVNDLFHRALDVPATDRAAFLARACGTDTALRAEVESLLDAHARASASSFIERPVAHVADASGQEALLTSGDTVGPYRIERLLGRGGMGVVYLATDTRLDRPVALKAVAPRFTSDPVRRERLRREARAAAGLSDPGIATVFAFETLDGQSYIASEFVPGRTLREELDEGPLPPDRAVQTALAIAQALAAAHARGIVHRDLKPENVVRTPSDTVKLLDFGLAVSEDDAGSARLTADGALLGTPAYMSPEQIRGEALDARADQFAFGVITQEMLTGRHPFAGAGPASTMAHILESDPPRLVPPVELGVVDGGIYDAMAPVIRTCLAKRPEERYASTNAMIDAILRGMNPPRRLVPGQSDAVDPPLASRGEHAIPAPTPDHGHARWWWQFHQATASGVYLALIAPLWAARELVPGAASLGLLVLGLAGAVTASALRLHRWFAARSYPAEWPRVRRRSAGPVRAADLVFLLALSGAGAMTIGARTDLGAFLIAAAAGVLVSFQVIEPSTERAAWGRPPGASGRGT